MWDQIYLFVIAATCGLAGGYLAFLFYSSTLASMEAMRYQTATTHIWKFSTGGFRTATWGDVWSQTGTGPPKEAKSVFWSVLGIALAAATAAVFFPPPALADGPPVPFLTWMNVLVPLGTFAIAWALGLGLANLAAQLGPGAVFAGGATPLLLALTLGASYLWTIPAWLPLAAVYVSGTGSTVVLAGALLVEARRGSRYGSPPVALAALGIFVAAATFSAIAYGLHAPRFNPLNSLLSAVAPGAGVPGPGGTPPLRLQPLESPIRLVTAGCEAETLPHRETYDQIAEVDYVLIEDARGVPVLLCAGPRIAEDSGRRKALSPEAHLFVGGVHPLDPCARLPLDDSELERLLSYLREAVTAAKSETPDWQVLSDSFDAWDLQRLFELPDDQRPSSRRIETLIAHRALERLQADTSVSAAASPSSVSTADPLELARRYVERYETDVPSAQNDFKIGFVQNASGGLTKMDSWNRLAPALAGEVWLGAAADEGLLAWLTERLGPHEVELPGEYEGRLDRPWTFPRPERSQTAVYLLSKSSLNANAARMYVEFDLRRTRPLQYRIRAIPESTGDSAYDPDDYPYASAPDETAAGTPPAAPSPGDFGIAEVPAPASVYPQEPTPLMEEPSLEGEPAASGPSLAEVARVWTSADRRFSVRASFVGLEDGHVLLRREDSGDLIRVALDRLSETDRNLALQAAP